MSSDSEQPVASSSRRTALSDKKQQRREALDRLKSSKNASKSRPQPAFLGADDDDDDDVNPFDGLGAVHAAAARKRAAADNGEGNSRGAGGGRDPLLDRVFDDLFDLDGPSGSGGGAAGSDDIAGVAGEGDDVEGAPAKKRRVVAKMDETRLTGPLGFPKLREELRKVKIKGKGHEVSFFFSSFHFLPSLLTLIRPHSLFPSTSLFTILDLLFCPSLFPNPPNPVPSLDSSYPPQQQDLRRVLTLYQLWSHEMFPRTNLRDTLQTVEKLCHKRSVQVCLHFPPLASFSPFLFACVHH